MSTRKITVTLSVAEVRALLLLAGNTADYDDALDAVLRHPAKRRAGMRAIYKLDDALRKARSE